MMTEGDFPPPRAADGLAYLPRGVLGMHAHVQHGWTALHRAVVGGSLEVAKALLAAGANVNAAEQVRCCLLLPDDC